MKRPLPVGTLYNILFVVKVNLEQVQARIAAAARTVGREPASVRLVCVTKGLPVDRIKEAVACGVREIGENRVQEAREKQPLLESDLRWHLVGHLQRNKIKQALELFDVIHSVDSMELIEALIQHAVSHPAASGRPPELLVQVNVSGEATKHGCRPEEAQVLAQAIRQSRVLTLAGFMTMAPFSDHPESARPFFRRLREIRDGADPALHLSMGMSQDFEVAVQEGATMVRIGTLIFGEK